MEQVGAYAAFFDFDDTLIRANSGRLFWDYCIEHRVYTPPQLGYVALCALRYLTGIDDTEEFVRNWAVCFRGWPEEKLARMAYEIFDTKIRKAIRRAAIEEIQRHKQQGARVVILSASTPYICEPVREHLRLDGVICTRLRTENGFFTGEFAGPYIFGEQKLLSAISYCEENGLELSKCYYYGDAFTDRFILEAVGHPVCVCPEPKLRELAQRKNWRIVDW